MPQSDARQDKALKRRVIDIERTTLPSIVTAGVIVGLLEVVLVISLAAFVFAGQLAEFVSVGIGMALVGTIVTGVIVAMLTTLPGTVNGMQDLPAAIMAVAAAAMVSRLPASASEDMVFATVAATIGLSTILTGAALYLLGRFRLGRLVRFLPYPVVGGFLAGTGWLLVTGAMGFMVDEVMTLASLPTLLQADMLLRWLPGILLGLVLLMGLERLGSGLIMPLLVAGSVAVFYLIATGLNGLSPDELSAQGWLLGPFPAEGLWQPRLWRSLGHVHWPTVFGQLPGIATLIVLSAVGLLLNATGLELAAGRDVSLDRELRVAGLGNMAGGLFGGLVGYQWLGLSVFAFRQGARRRLVGVIGAAICLAALFLGAQFLSLFPKVVVGGLLFYLGLSFLKEWVVDTWHRLPRIEYAVIISILCIIGVVGILEGVAIGLLVAVVLFVVAYSRIEVVRYSLTGRHIGSRVTRSRAVQRRLEEEMDRLHILQLQGFLFFGTAERLLDRVRRKVGKDEAEPAHYLLLDFRRVTGMDSTAMLSFAKLAQIVAAQNITLLIVRAAPVLKRQLEHGGLPQGDHVRYFDSLEQGVGWCEDDTLVRLGETAHGLDQSLRAQLEAIVPDASLLDRLYTAMDRISFATGEVLIQQGDKADNMFFVASGQVTAWLERPGSRPVRLESVGQGRVVGELGLYLGSIRTATVRADHPGVAYRLTRDALRQLEQEDPGAAAALHRIIVHLLTERVTHLIGVVDSLEQ
jgi:SulP family sulfate permease